MAAPVHTGVMRALVQRVHRAEVRWRRDAGCEFDLAGRIGPGLCVLVGVTHTDTEATARALAAKIWHLRILPDADGVMDLSVAQQPDHGILVVSQFTLYGDTSRGRRPSWVAAARPEVAEPLVDELVAELGRLGATVATGVFRTEMQVELVNDGPVTVMLEL